MDWNLPKSINRRSSVNLFNLAELFRIKAYLARAELKLRSADVSGLSESKIQKRYQLISNLSEYRSGKIFPKNDFVSSYSSVFRDRSGTICAVAHLLQTSGRGDLVDKVAMENNLMSLSKVKTNLFDEWLEENGIKYEEAAYVQVPYNQQPEAIERAASSGHNSIANILIVVFIVTTIFVLGATLLGLRLKRKRAKETKGNVPMVAAKI